MNHRRLIAAGAAALFPLTGAVVAVVAGAVTAVARQVRPGRRVTG